MSRHILQDEAATLHKRYLLHISHYGSSLNCEVVDVGVDAEQLHVGVIYAFVVVLIDRAMEAEVDIHAIYGSDIKAELVFAFTSRYAVRDLLDIHLASLCFTKDKLAVLYNTVVYGERLWQGCK